MQASLRHGMIFSPFLKVVTLTNVFLYLASHPWTIIYTTYSPLDKRGVTISHLKECGLKIEPEFVNTNDILICCPGGIHSINPINTSKVFTKLCRVLFCINPENFVSGAAFIQFNCLMQKKTCHDRSDSNLKPCSL